MKAEALDYDLPEELIAQQPAKRRSESRLLVLDRQSPSTLLRTSSRITDSRFARIGEFLRAADCLVLNNTKVLAAKFFARRQTGGNLEGLFLQRQDDGLWEVMLKGLGKIRPKEQIRLNDVKGRDFCLAELIEKKNDGKCLLRVNDGEKTEEILKRIGFAPLPPYIKRDINPQQAARDSRRYQTVYASRPGAVAAPTAGLHFTRELLTKLKNSGVKIAYITLHVGEGTFKPVKTRTLEEHIIHAERFSIDRKNAGVINDAKKTGGRIIATGTTSVRVLETACVNGMVQAMSGQTDLFIMPGYRFKMVDAMITNFHLPRSTLLALVAAFAGLETILQTYRYAVEKRYRFYSYGDAMLIL